MTWKKYKCYVAETKTISVDVMARSETEAMEKAEDMAPHVDYLKAQHGYECVDAIEYKQQSYRSREE